MKPLFNGLEGALLRMACGESGDNGMLSPRISRKLYFMMGNFGWRHMQRKSRMKKKTCTARPMRSRRYPGLGI